MNLPKFMYLLQESALYLPKMSIFEDHLEGGLTAKDYLSTSNDAVILDAALNVFWPTADNTIENHKNRLEQADAIQRELKSRTFETPSVYINVTISKKFSRNAGNGFMSVAGTNHHMSVLLCGRCMALIRIQYAYSAQKISF